MRDSFVFYRSFYEAIKLLPKKYQHICFQQLCEYALNDKPLEGLPGTVEAILKSFKPQVDANNRRYENGLKGGRPKGNQTETKQKPKHNQTETKPKRNDNDNVNDNVNVNVNDNDNDNALGSSGRSGGGFDSVYGIEDEFNIWKKLTPDDVDTIYESYQNTGGYLIQAVYEDVKKKKKKVGNAVAYILGYADKVRWDDNADHVS